ncbi:MAG: hypothetical protein Q9196_004833 [Gyalolechia fulgens]
MLAEHEKNIDRLESMAFNISSLTGVGLGPIDAKFLTRQAWPIHNAEQMIQYRKFVQLMIHRIRAGESNDGETERFTTIFDWTNNWIYVFPVLGMLPELDDGGPLPMNDQMNMLIDHVGRVVDAKDLERMKIEEQSREPKPPMTEKAVTEEVRCKIARLLLGPEGEANASSAMKRLLSSWVEVGYPREVIQQALDDTGKGKTMARDNLGLPTGLGEPGSTNHHPGAIGIPAPLTADPSQRARTSLTKFLPCHSVPAEYGSSEGPVERRSNTSYRKFPPTAGESSAEFSDSPPKTLLQSRTKKISHAPVRNSAPDQSEGESSFWHFHKSHKYDYEKYLQPVTGADRLLPQLDAEKQTPVSTEITKEGIIVAKGFDKPPVAESHAMLKRIVENAAALSASYYSEDEDGDEALDEETSSLGQARRRPREAFSTVDDLSDSETIVSKDSSVPMARENTAPTRTRGLPILHPREVVGGSAKEGRSLEEATNQLEAMIMTEGQGSRLEPLDPSDASSWTPLGQSQPATWGAEDTGAELEGPATG